MAFTLHSFPRAILHIDGDCFFASVEMAKNPELKGKCVVTGVERGIASSLSYEAKARGVTRGMPLHEIQKICPEVVLIPSDYETYSLYSLRMYNIVRRYTSEVEEYSIDECFADITGMRRPLHMSYEQIAKKIKHDLDTELGVTFSVGLAPTKVLAKVASKWQKPSGLTCIPGRNIENYLKDLSVEKIWGIGPQTTNYLRKFGIETALQYAKLSKEWTDIHMTKPHKEIWEELRGISILKIDTKFKPNSHSISKTRTFTPPSSDKDLVFSQLSKNIENACIKARRHKLRSKKIFFFLKTQEFRYHGIELKLTRASNTALDFIQLIKMHFETIFKHQILYRATGIILSDLQEHSSLQLELFSDLIGIEKLERMFCGVDELQKKYGKHTLFLGSSLKAIHKQHEGSRSTQAERKVELFKGETFRKRLYIPYLGQVH